jgi:sugar-specific transcriptional regulator TrmB
MPLVDFGFTNTQDIVYKALVRLGPATGYAVARDVNIARANVYQALDSLVIRGLASASGGRPSTFTAVSPADCLRLLGVRTALDIATLAGELGVEAPPPGSPASAGPSGGCVRPADLLGAAARAIDGSQREVLAVLGPWAGEVVAAAGRAQRRGLASRVVHLGDDAPEGAVRRPVAEAELIPYWGGLPVLLVCDRAHAVCGVVRNGAAEGIETRSAGVVPFLRHLLRRELATAAAPR